LGVAAFLLKVGACFTFIGVLSMKIISCNNDRFGEPLIILDSNTYIEFAHFYYNGKCSSPERTNFVRCLLVFSRILNGSFQYDIAGNEIAFDYGLNDKNDDAWEQAFSAVDSLVVEVPTEDIIGFRRPVEKPFYLHRNNLCLYKSVFETNYPRVFSIDNNPLDVFYISYLYRIKIQELYQDKALSSIKKIEHFFDYMTDTIGIFGDIEFQVAKMLFIGHQDSQTAKNLLKVDKHIDVALLNNTVSDIVQFRIAREIGTRLSTPVFYVTGDKGLQRMFELNKTLVSSNFNIGSVSGDLSDIRPTLKKAWQELYEVKIYPAMKRKFVMSPFIKRDLDSIIRQVKEEIVKVERKIIG
jgi:hypothetical protein